MVFRVDYACVAMQNGQGAIHAKPGFARVPWVKKERPAEAFAKRLVGVAEDNDVWFFASDSCPERVGKSMGIHYVMYQEFAAREFNDSGLSVRKPSIISIP
jgi:hypothetical protein